MILHLVLFRLKPRVAPDDVRFAAAVAAMAGLPGKIPEIRLWQHGRHLLGSDAQSCDYGLAAGFDDETALIRYFEHPDHAPVVAAWEEISDLVYADFPAGTLYVN